jgi:DNA polymerase-3 subunit alpha (Gram-positive type)
MHNYCIIPNSSSEFLSFIAGLSMDKCLKDVLKKCRIPKVEIDTAANCWEIHLYTPAPIPQEAFTPVVQKLCRDCGLSDVTIKQDIKSLEKYLDTDWNEFVQIVAHDNPAVQNILGPARRNFDGHTLLIEVACDLSAEMISSGNVIENIRNFAKREFNQSCEVNIRITNQAEAGSAGNDLLTPEYLDALKECAEQTPAKKKVFKSKIIFGRNIKDSPQPIVTIDEEARNVTVKGQITSFELRELRSGRQLLTFDLSDGTDGISGKVFFDDKGQFDKAANVITAGLAVIVKGTVQYDKYANELVMFADSMCLTEKKERQDEASRKRLELHAHTQMSNMDAVVSVKNLITTAAQWGHSAIAITDHGVVQAFPEAYTVAEKAGIKIIYGMEGYLFDNDINQARHIVILARNPVGLRNLYRLVSISHLKYLHRTPRIPRTVLQEHREGLILGSACEAGELIQAIINGCSDDELLKIADFYDYLEIQPIGNNAFLVREGKVADDNALRAINVKVCRLGEKLNKPVVATGDVHFLNPEDEIYRRILMAGKGFADADHQPPLYLRTTDEMLQEVEYLGEEKACEVVIENPLLISNMIETFKPIPDELYSPQIPGAEEQIRSMSYHRAKELYGTPLPKIVSERLENELNSIINHGFAVLYLIAHKLVKKSLDDGYLVGSRGSVGSSFVATMTNITEVNPLPPHWLCKKCKHSEFVTDGSYGGGFDLPDKNCPHCGIPMIKNGHDIPFAVFMGFHGDKVPDIDLNFSGDYQPVAHKYTEELFGRDNVFRAGTIATIADKTAYGFVKNYFGEKGLTPRNAYINSLVAGCTGVKRTTGQHPGGIMVVPRDMDVHHFTPIQRPADDKNSSTITTHFDYHSISSRLVKLDILGHDDPTVIKMLEDLTGMDPKTIPFDDAETMSLFRSTDALKISAEQLGSKVGTFGIPEFGTKFVRQMLEDTTPKTFSELVRISGFSHGTDVWLNNAQDLIKTGTAKLSEAISARDDIMLYLIHKGVAPQLAFKIMECVRKGKGIKPEDVDKIRENDVPEWYIESCQKIKYMFPKAHAVAYVMMAFRIAWFKVHQPLAFYASYFTVRAAEFDADLIVQGENALRAKLSEFEQKGNAVTAKEKNLQTILEMALEMYLRGFTFHSVDLYNSDATKFAIVDNGLLPPLAALQGVGDNAARNIVEARSGRAFLSIEDLRNRARIYKAVVDILRGHGCLGELPEDDQIMLFA